MNVEDRRRREEFDHASEKLEFRALLDLIAGGARSERARETVLETAPLESPERILESQRETAELVELCERGECLPLDDWKDSWDVLDRIRAEGAVAGAEELVRIADGERAARRIARFLESARERAPVLFRHRSRFAIQDELIERIERTIGPDHVVLDRASDALATVRRETAKLRAHLRKAFTSFAERAGSGRGYEFVTVRGERYVVSLPRGDAARIRGIIHHESASGASVYLEPLEFVEDNNRLEQLVEEERREVERILRELTSEVFARRTPLVGNQDGLCALDVVAAKACFARRFRCREPGHSDDGAIVMRGARHPLLEKRFADAGRSGELVPLELSCSSRMRTIVVSGPNAGGKTVALKTVGLLVLMDRSGLLVPCADGTTLPPYDAVHVDIGDDQSIEKSLSTFSSRVVRMKTILASADRNSLVLVDEIGDGTDPDEGAALAEAMLARLTERAGTTIVTTHLGRLKGWAHETEGAVNATLEFDPERIEPLFSLRMGVPGRSWGIEMAGRLGLDPGIIEQARAGLGEHALRLEELLADLERTEREVERNRQELVERERTLTDLIVSYRERLERFTRDRDVMAEEARREALEIISATRREMEHLVQEIRASQAQREKIQRSRETMRERERRIEETMHRKERRPHFRVEEIVPGMVLGIESLRRSGTVLSIKGPSKVLLELPGGLRVETSIDDLAPRRTEERVRKGGRVTWSTGAFEEVSTELMVRGLERAEALEKVDHFLDRAVLQGLKQVVIIHGVGKGILRRAIYDMLKKDPRVRDVHPGDPAAGGDGVAVVELT